MSIFKAAADFIFNGFRAFCLFSSGNYTEDSETIKEIKKSLKKINRGLQKTERT